MFAATPSPGAGRHTQRVAASAVQVLAQEIVGPEGPSALTDGTAAIVSFVSGDIWQVMPDGRRKRLAAPGAGVAGTTVGPDGALYIAKLDTAKFLAQLPPAPDPPSAKAPPPLPASPAAIIRIDPATRVSKTLYTQHAGEDLQGPNDLVVDGYGDLWFTDVVEHAVYWARTDGSEIRRVLSGVAGVNGIALSPDRRRLYIVSERRLLAYTLRARGRLLSQSGEPVARKLADWPANIHEPDGLETDASGNILGACWEDGILVFNSRGRLLRQVKVEGLSVINIALADARQRTLYLAAHPADSMVGSLSTIRWPAGAR
ncbi:MAG: SMP-30/gluconolactonase/LRE family protein [Gammaproteobacteria bacterium]|nr:SMP-30/gluconolactonase/LRE family protein [Gammaproteobacteria bacterium]